MNALQCARYVYKTEGIRGFYRGLTASYAGISETMICFLIYETLKKHLAKSQFASPTSENEKGASDFLGLMMAAAFSKGCASCIAYPHGKHLRCCCCYFLLETTKYQREVSLTRMTNILLCLCLQRLYGRGCVRKAASTSISSRQGG